MYKFAIAFIGILLSLSTYAEWKLDSKQSQLLFVTTKANHVGETHSFSRINATINDSGKAQLTIDLTSVDTNIDIRDERMRNMLFETAKYPTAMLSLQVKPELLNLEAGSSTQAELEGELNLHGATTKVSSVASITKLANGELLVNSAQPILLSANSVNLVEGVEKLREVAGLNSISYNVTVTYSLRFKQ